jgi:hypothetical protein
MMRGGKIKHGQSHPRSAEYRTWCAMRERCNSHANIEYHRYGGAGVKVCRRWDNFAAFLADVGLRPSPVHSLDRFPDRNGDYRPGNVRWATPSEQQRNRRNSIILAWRGQRRHILEWGELLGLSINTIRRRLRSTRRPSVVLAPVRSLNQRKTT